MTEHEPITRGTVAYWAGMVLLIVAIVAIAAIIFRAPAKLGI
ncbi:MAG TPA: hypothetical protein VFW66_13655 [Gemmatimonadales bacterium]|nr:hypothetical protein [Gemmatimonadales bacterium]